ncbi:F-type H+-transporting ATPase subunit gamma [Methylomarinovum caldicuralii]|uniref:F-type H+-transporting ATPase subunit gamma n=1 Tax=Methylomarinovum caldicuralii TaxID=438856 RepID=A0AAU9C757_9GAMM|nr:F0F1 ATP synthase subunit gamma [Methylomarinovum caldicuralii]BCX81839.1 F-type H+-transporting ATPase subunit gamma [Methylomarinovum caldicuralii]
MSKRREVETHLHALEEIRAICAAMKNLSYMETRKLARFIDAQNQAVATVERAAADFLHGYPELRPQPAGEAVLLLLLGSERGFCGDYNEQLLAQLEAHCRRLGCRPRLLVIGTKLAEHLEADPRIAAVLPGAEVAEEVPRILQQVITTLDELEGRFGPVQVSALYTLGHEWKTTALLPPFQNLPPPPPQIQGPPFLYLAPGEFVTALTDQYLFAVLHALFYSALLTEHQRRIQHLEGALRRLDDQREQLKVRLGRLRQEEITEEIEQILLSVQAVAAELENI